MPDTQMVLMDGLVKSHRLILAASNSFLHQLICSSWIPGETSTFIMPQHSVKDLILDFSLLGNAFTANGKGLYDGETKIGEEEKKRLRGFNNETSYDFGEIKVEESDNEEENISDDHNGDHPPVNIEEFEQPVEIFRENNVSLGFEQTLKVVVTPRKRLRPECPSSKSLFEKRRREDDDEQSGKSDFIAKDALEDNLIVELFRDNVTIAEAVKTDDPDSRGSEFGMVNEEIDVETRLNKTLVNSSSNNVKPGMIFGSRKEAVKWVDEYSKENHAALYIKSSGGGKKYGHGGELVFACRHDFYKSKSRGIRACNNTIKNGCRYLLRFWTRTNGVTKFCSIRPHSKDTEHNHQSKHHSQEIQEEQHENSVCELCGKACPSERSLKEHMKTHSSAYACKNCKKTFTMRSYLSKHMARRHSQEMEEK